MAYFCYMVQCADGSYYTGWSTDPQRRVSVHNAGRGARYTRTHGPVQLIYIEEQPDHSSALKRERAIKKLSHEQKHKLAQKQSEPMNKDFSSSAQFSVVAPGRVNLLGEHVDYNGGVVLPAAIDRSLNILARERMDDVITIQARDLNEETSFSLNHLDKKVDLTGAPLSAWTRYPAGVAWVLRQHGLAVKGIEAVFTSNIPMGSGLSSSAALEVGFAALWQEIGGWPASRLLLAQYCQQAENQYVGVNCGLMDQFACANGVKNHAVAFDTRSLEFHAVPLPAHTCIIIADTGMRRELTNSAYNDRRAACEKAVEILKTRLPGIQTLRDVSLDDFNRYASLLPAEVYKRARHIVEEIDRVEKAQKLLAAGDAVGFGKLVYACHVSLRDLYEVSIPELDAMVEAALPLPGCYGARLTGAGFGGCTVNLVEESQAETFIQGLKEGYRKTTGRTAEVYLCRATEGVRVSRI